MKYQKKFQVFKLEHFTIKSGEYDGWGDQEMKALSPTHGIFDTKEKAETFLKSYSASNALTIMEIWI